MCYDMALTVVLETERNNMIVNDKDALSRINSPINLINRMKNLSSDPKRSKAMSLFIKPTIDITAASDDDKTKVTFNPFKDNKAPASDLATIVEPTSIDDISSDHDSKIELALAHDSALKLLTASVSALSAKLDDVKADKLPSVIAAASRTVESIRRERNEVAKTNKNGEVHYHFYTPAQKKLSDYAVVEVSQ